MDSVRAGELHPLYNHHILERIFKTLNLKDLKSCRQVCKLWCETCAPEFRQVGYAHIKGGEGRETFNFLELVQREESTFTLAPFINGFYIRSQKNKIPDEFWEFFGESLSGLAVDLDDQCGFLSGDDLRCVIFKLCPNLEHVRLYFGESSYNQPAPENALTFSQFPQNRKLKSLVLKDFQFHDISHAEIFYHFPCLQDLIAYSAEKNSLDIIFSTLTQKWLENDECLPLTKLRFNFDSLKDPLEIVPVLTKGVSSLENLHAYDLKRSDDLLALKEILEAHAASLKELRIELLEGLDINDVFHSQNTHIFKSLGEILIYRCKISSVNFLRSFSSLKKLELSRNEFTREFQLEHDNDNWSLESCTELKLSWSWNGSKEDLEILLRRLPNVTNLEMTDCDNEMFAVICRLLPKLTYLNLKCSKIDNFGISGWDPKKLKRQGWWGVILRESNPFRPNLTFLKNLKWFSWDREEIGGIYAYSAESSIRELPKLKHLRIIGSSKEPMWKELCAEFPWKDYF